MEKQQFDQLPIEHKLEYIRPQLDLFVESVRKRMEILPLVSALSATLLVVATFGDKIIPYNNIVRLLLSLLLAIVPISLFFYNYDLKKAAKKSKDTIDKLLGRSQNGRITDGQALCDRVIGHLPDVIIYLLMAIIGTLIYFVWHR